MTKAVVLYAEDNPGDRTLVRNAFSTLGANVLVELHVVENGLEALAFLNRKGKYANAPQPNLIMLDLNMPLMDGADFLSELKANPRFLGIPAIVFSSSMATWDVNHCYNLHANCYVMKPFEVGRYIDLIQQIARYWFLVAQIPGQPTASAAHAASFLAQTSE